MNYHVPTVDELLAESAIGNGFHSWPVEGGSIRITTTHLRHALQEVYDPAMPDWVAFVDVNDLAD